MGGRYRLERELGAGGMGAVWIAVQEGLGRRVALKTLLPALARDAQAVTRFKREAELAASLGHPHIVQVTDFGSDAGGAFLVMELLQGRSLAEAIAAEAPMSAARLATIGQQVLAALGAAHDAGVVHRDLKPDNVFLTEVAGGGELVKLLDFGIARMALGDVGTRLTQTGQLLGTPLYMAPEQAQGDEVDARTDLYALGSMLYEGATGRPPFAAPNYAALLAAIITEAPPALASLRPDLPPDFVAIVETAMAKDAGHRFANAEAMGRALGSMRSVESRPDSGLGFAATMAAPSVDASAATMAAPESASEPPRPGTVALKVKPLADTAGGTKEPPKGPDRDAATMELPRRAPTDRDAATRELAETADAASPAAEPPKRDRSWMGVVATLLIVGIGVAAAYARRHGLPTFDDPAVASTDTGTSPPPPEPAPTPAPEEVTPAPPAPTVEAGPHYRNGVLLPGGDAQPIPDQLVRLLLQDQNDALRDCGPAPPGPLLFRFEVDEHGDVASGAVGADPRSEANRCRLEVVKRIGFSPNARGRYSVRHDFR